MRVAISLLVLSATACVSSSPVHPDDAYVVGIKSLCGQGAFAGTLVSTDEVDAAFGRQPMIMGPAVCEDSGIRIPFAVGEDRSRTWVMSWIGDTVRLKHDHRHQDGGEDVLTQYGGDALGAGTAARQEFPVDDETRALFTRETIEVSNQNTWAVEIRPGVQFAYEMSRPERFFRIEFDLTTPVPAPPLPWGVEPIQ